MHIAQETFSFRPKKLLASEELFSNQIIYKPGSVEALPYRTSHLSSPSIAQRIKRVSM